MSGTMIQADLVADLKSSLQESAEIFVAANDADFKRHLDLAALDIGRYRSRTMVGSLTLIADQYAYPAPADFLVFKSALWGVDRPKPWEKTWPGRLPDIAAVMNGSVRELHFSPAPSGAQIAQLGAAYTYYYFARHLVDATAAANTTIVDGDRGLLLLRAQAEAMKEMAMRNIKKPVQMRDGISSSPKNGTPTALFEMLMVQFEEQAVRWN